MVVLNLFGEVLLLLISVCVVITCARLLRVNPLTSLLIFSVPVVVITMDSILHLLPTFPDSALYVDLGKAIEREWASSPVFQSESRLRVLAYSLSIAAIYEIFSPNAISPVLINSVAWAVACTFWLRLIDDFPSDDLVPLAGISYAFYPAAVLYTTAVLREAFTLLFSAVACYSICQWFRYRRWKSLGVASAGLLLLGILRPELLPVYLVSTVGTLIWINRRSINLLVVVLLPLSVIPLVTAIEFAPFIPNYVNPFDISLLEGKRAASAGRLTPYLQGWEYSSWFDVIISLPVRMFYLLFSPFPWESESYQMFIISVDAVYILLLSILFIIGTARILARDPTPSDIFVISVAVLTIIGYSLIVSNQNVAPRRRLYAVPLMILISVSYVRLLIRVQLRFR